MSSEFPYQPQNTPIILKTITDSNILIHYWIWWSYAIDMYMFYMAGACPGIRKGRAQILLFFRGGGPAQKIAEKMIFPTKKVAKYRWNSLKFALMTFFLAFQFLGGGGAQAPPPWTRACMVSMTQNMYIFFVSYALFIFVLFYLMSK